jgi:hypothetical protein
LLGISVPLRVNHEGTACAQIIIVHVHPLNSIDIQEIHNGIMIHFSSIPILMVALPKGYGDAYREVNYKLKAKQLPIAIAFG